MVRWALGKNVHPVKIHVTGGQFTEDSDSEVPNVQVGSFEYEDGTLVEIDATTLPSPTFGGVHMGEFFYTPRGYISSEGDWKTVEGRFTAGHHPRPALGRFLSRLESELPQDRVRRRARQSPPRAQSAEDSSHFENFIQCVRSRKREDLHCEIEQGHLSTSLCHLANISLRTGRKLTFDPKTETFPGDEEANGFLTRKYREPYVVPDEV